LRFYIEAVRTFHPLEPQLTSSVGQRGDMSFLKFIFGRSKSTPGDYKGLEEHLNYLKTLRAPAIALAGSQGEAFSQIGGLPILPEGVNWP